MRLKWTNVGWFVFKWFSLSSNAVMRKGVSINGGAKV